jgi:hypothetical protein
MRARRLPAALVFVAVAAAAAARPVAHEQTSGQDAQASALNALLARVEQRVLEYFARAQSIVCEETMRVDGFDRNFSSSTTGVSRRVVSELRVAWDASGDGDAPEATIQRQILTINGRPPKPHDEDDCFDPKPVSPEPLAMFVMPHRKDYVFTAAGTKKIDGRQTVAIDYAPSVPPGKPTVAWSEGCVHVELPHWEHGRVFVDAETAAIVRRDESITRRYDFDVPLKKQLLFGTFLTIERVDASTHYKPIAFHDPEETVLLPESIDTMQVFGHRTRITQTFKNYRRFMTGGRLVKDPR